MINDKKVNDLAARYRRELADRDFSFWSGKCYGQMARRRNVFNAKRRHEYSASQSASQSGVI